MKRSKKKMAVVASIVALTMSASLNVLAAENDDDSLKNKNFYLAYENSCDSAEPIYVIGHLSPDSDTVCSAIAFAYFLNQLGYDAEPAVSGQLNAETSYVLEQFDVETPEILSEAGDKQFILVDHSSYEQSITGMEDANVIGILDHHAVGNISTGSPVMYIGMPVGCTSTIVYKMYKDYDVAITEEMAGMMMSAILSDTMDLKSTTTTDYDRTTVDELSSLAGIDDYDTYAAEMFEAGNILDSMTAGEILKYDYKEYTSGETLFSIAEVQSADEGQLERIEEDLDIYMAENFDSLGVSMCYVMMTNQATLETDLLCYGEDALEIAQEAFNTDEDEIILENTTSRKKQIAPPLMKEFEDY